MDPRTKSGDDTLSHSVMPAKAGIHGGVCTLDPSFRWGDEIGRCQDCTSIGQLGTVRRDLELKRNPAKQKASGRAKDGRWRALTVRPVPP